MRGIYLSAAPPLHLGGFQLFQSTLFLKKRAPLKKLSSFTMKNLHNIYSLLDSGSSTAVKAGARKIQFPLPSDLGTGYSEHTELLDGIKIIRDVYNFNKGNCLPELPLGKFQAHYPVNTFAIHIMNSGRLDFRGAKNCIKRTAEFALFGRFRSFEIDQCLFTDEDISLTILPIPEDTLFKLLGLNNSQILFENLGLLELDTFSEIKIPKTISNKLGQCIPEHLDASMRVLYAQSLTLQFLLELNLWAASSKNLINGEGGDKFNVAYLHHDLLQISATIPSLTSLANKYNVTTAILNKAFVKEYGESVHSFISNQRLERAYQALVNSSIPTKVLADKIGYSHVNHFISAFKKKYGITPGSIRQKYF